MVDPELIRVAKSMQRGFNKTDLPDDEDGLVKEIRLLIEKQVNEIESYKTRYEGRKYHGMSLLNKGLKYFGEFHKGVDNASFFAKMKELQKDLSYWEEDMAYLKSFLTRIKGIFDKGISAISKHEENRTYLIGEKAEEDARQLKEILDNPIPYGKIKFIPEIINKMESSIQAVLDEKERKQKKN